MLEVSQGTYDALAEGSADRFARRVCDFLEGDYPERLGVDEESTMRIAQALIVEAGGFGLITQSRVLRFISMKFDYFIHDPRSYRWAHDLLSDPDIREEEKIIGLEHRLYGSSLWA